MKVIFLDIDGVLNTSLTFKRKKLTGYPLIEIDDFRMSYLKELVVLTDAKIVLSATLRMHFTKVNGFLQPLDEKAVLLLNVFNSFGLEVYDITDCDPKRWRENEILKWLNMHDDVESFVIFDDEAYDLKIFQDHELVHIKTKYPCENEMENGLLLEHVQKAVNILYSAKV